GLRARAPALLRAAGVLGHRSPIVLSHHEGHRVAAADAVAVFTEEHEEALGVAAGVADLDEAEALLAHPHDLPLHRLAEGEHTGGHAVLALDERSPRHEVDLGSRVQL